MAAATKSSSPSDSRLEARVPREVKNLIQQAADNEGRSLTDFMIGSLVAAATQSLERGRVLRLSQRDSERFVELILNPPEPNDRLREAMAAHAAMVISED